MARNGLCDNGIVRSFSRAAQTADDVVYHVQSLLKTQIINIVVYVCGSCMSLVTEPSDTYMCRWSLGFAVTLIGGGTPAPFFLSSGVGHALLPSMVGSFILSNWSNGASLIPPPVIVVSSCVRMYRWPFRSWYFIICRALRCWQHIVKRRLLCRGHHTITL